VLVANAQKGLLIHHVAFSHQAILLSERMIKAKRGLYFISIQNFPETPNKSYCAEVPFHVLHFTFISPD